MSIEQLNIDFPSKGNFSSFWWHLSNKLEPLTNGIPLQEWVEFISNKLYQESKNGTDYVHLEKYFELRKIKNCVHNNDLAVDARLINNGTSFTIQLKDYGERNDPRKQRFLIAHEIAHTFFFNISRESIIDYHFFPAGSKEIEFLCNRIARGILMPNIILINKLQRVGSLDDVGFSLDQINKLCETFRVPYTVLLNRIILDTGFWKCLFLRFRNYKTEENNWKLRERYLPAIYWNNIKAFIPQEDHKKNKDDPNRYPSAKGELKSTFDSVYLELKEKKRLTKRLSLESINDSPIKGFLKTYFNTSEKVTFHFSLGNLRYSTIEYLNVCIPLPRTL